MGNLEIGIGQFGNENLLHFLPSDFIPTSFLLTLFEHHFWLSLWIESISAKTTRTSTPRTNGPTSAGYHRNPSSGNRDDTPDAELTGNQPTFGFACLYPPFDDPAEFPPRTE